MFFLICPALQGMLIGARQHIAKLGAFGTFLYGFLLRLTGAGGTSSRKNHRRSSEYFLCTIS